MKATGKPAKPAARARDARAESSGIKKTAAKTTSAARTTSAAAPRQPRRAAAATAKRPAPPAVRSVSAPAAVAKAPGLRPLWTVLFALAGLDAVLLALLLLR